MIDLLLDGGATAQLVRLDGERAALVCAQAFAPGTPLSASSAAGKLELKVSRSIRRTDGQFDVEARTVNLTRTVRERLAELL
jgi:hypothetical protein